MSTKQQKDFDKMDIEQIQESLQKINFGAPGKKAEGALKGIMQAALKKGIMPKQALQINDDTMEAIYTQAYNLYNQAKYRDASYIFRLLMLLDFTMPKYVLGLAACAHRLRDFTNAANLYYLCGALDPSNPLPHFHAADCYMQLGAVAIASYSLSVAITTAGMQPQYEVIKQRAELMKEAVDKQLDAIAPDEAEEGPPASEEAQTSQ